MQSSQRNEMRRSQRGAWLSIVAYLILTALKMSTGWWSGSNGLVADGINNMTDVLGSIAVLLGLRVAIRPADADHRYGHQRAENVAAVVVAVIMGLISVNVAASSVQGLIDPGHRPPDIAAAWVGSASALAMLGVYSYNSRLAKKTGSKALKANAYDNRSDALTSVGSVVGILASRAGWGWGDPAAGFIIALVTLYTAWRIGYDGVHTLMDGFDAESLKQIRSRIGRVEGVATVRDVRARHLGSTVAVELTVSVSPSLNVEEAHRICDQIERSLLGYMSIDHVHVHVEPI